MCKNLVAEKIGLHTIFGLNSAFYLTIGYFFRPNQPPQKIWKTLNIFLHDKIFPTYLCPLTTLLLIIIK